MGTWNRNWIRSSSDSELDTRNHYAIRAISARSNVAVLNAEHSRHVQQRHPRAEQQDGAAQAAHAIGVQFRGVQSVAANDGRVEWSHPHSVHDVRDQALHEGRLAHATCGPIEHARRQRHLADWPGDLQIMFVWCSSRAEPWLLPESSCLSNLSRTIFINDEASSFSIAG